MSGTPEYNASMLDVAFAVEGGALPQVHRHALADAIDAALPWLRAHRGAGVHRLNVSAGSGPQPLLSRRTCLTLRLSREHAADAQALAGATLALGTGWLRLGPAHERELLPWGTLYAHLVATEPGVDELDFLRAMQAELATLGIQARSICGRRQVLDGGRLHGFGLMLDGLSADEALRLLETGLGPHRRLGCGLFVPHKSAAAVGAPA